MAFQYYRVFFILATLILVFRQKRNYTEGWMDKIG
jgi:hypothetical protein